MRKFLCTTAIAMLSAGTLPALAAESGAAPQTVEVTSQRSATTAVPSRPAPRVDDTHYELSNGSRLKVASYGDIVEMRYDHRRAQVLRHDGQGSFTSRDGAITLKFESDVSGRNRLVYLAAPATWF